MYICNMEKVLKIVSLKNKETDFSYWSSKSELQRLEAIEILRCQYINYQKDAQQGFQRVCTVINKEQG